jgi:DNA invertase Pin-like site-specific DNA recombinase
VANRSSNATPNSTESASLVRAAQYVRMSTEHQKYSTANQADALLRYATARSFAIVRTYEDSGKSGLRLDGRDALQQLIADVRSGNTNFSAVLVYDVSRWGRFQDADESAYYEFVCKEAGIAVHYCAEQFENDGSLSATIIKSMKRAMAGEYSRELSAKVFAGQCRLISLGFRQGGAAGFGLRRMLIDEHRHPKGELERGMQKSLQTDRVILVHGPEAEVATVRRVYRLFIEGRSEREIAALLNEEGCRTDLDRPWTRGTVHQMLTNEKYVGNNVYNRTSFKLKAARVVNPPDMWVRANGAFESVVDVDLFEAVQSIIEARSRRYSDSELLDALSGLLRRHGMLSGLLIDEQEAMPSSSAYRSRFGTLLRAYQLVGYAPGRDYEYVAINRALRQMHPGVVAHVRQEIERTGGSVRMDSRTDLLVVNEEFTTSVVISRCQSKPTTPTSRWHLRFDSGLRPDITVAVRMAPSNREPLDYYILPRIDIDERVLRLADENGARIDAYRTDTLTTFFQLAARTPLREVA